MANLNKIKQIAFSEQILEAAEARLAHIGISFSEYVRHLVIKDLEEFKREQSQESHSRNPGLSITDIRADL